MMTRTVLVALFALFALPAAAEPVCAVQPLVDTGASAAPVDDEEPPPVAPPVTAPRSTLVALVGARTASHLDGGGLRVGVEVPAGPVLHVGAAVQGLTLEGSTFHDGHFMYDGIDENRRRTVDLLGTLRLTGALGRVRLQPQLAVGGGAARHDLTLWEDEQPYPSASTSIGVRGDASLTASVGISRRWRADLTAAAGVATYRDVHQLTRQTPIRLDSVNSIALGLRYEP
jgi:hypothetical protein